jgi:hypothetical protein
MEIVEKCSEVKLSDMKGSEVAVGKGRQIVVRKLGLRECNEVKCKEDHGDKRVQQFVTEHIALLLTFSV